MIINNNTHTHEDGTAHGDHSCLQKSEYMEQESFKVETSEADLQEDTQHNHEHSHGQGCNHKH